MKKLFARYAASPGSTRSVPMLTVELLIVTFLLSPPLVSGKENGSFPVTSDVIDFITEVMVHVFNATHVEVLCDSEFDDAATMISSKLHLSSISVTSVRVHSRASTLAFVERIVGGFSTNTKFHVVCLLSQEDYLTRVVPLTESAWTHLVYSYWIVPGHGSKFAKLILQQRPCTFYLLTKEDQEYVLLGPGNAKRNNCSGKLAIARWPKPPRANTLMLAPPAKEKRSDVLTLACDVLVATEEIVNCTFPPDAEVLSMMRRFLSVTRLEPVASPLPFAPDDKFPQAGTLTGLLTHGESDIVLHQVTMNEHRAFSTRFTFPMKYYNFAYLYPSPAAVTGSFTVLKIFSIAVWCMFGVSLALLFILLRGITGLKERSLTVAHFDDIMLPSQNTARQSQKPSVRMPLVMLHFLFFVMSYCFTSGYTSFLNMPILEEAPDTKEKLLTVLRTGSLQPCIWVNSFANATIAKSRSAYISQLRAAVLEWSPFIADSLDICAERTRRRKAVLFTSRHVLEWYEHAFRGQVDISNDFWLGSRPMCYVLPRASPYENAVQNAVMRIFEAGLFNEFERRYRYHNFPAPKDLSTKDSRRVLRMEDFKLPFVILCAGFGASSLVLVCEAVFHIRKRKQNMRTLELRLQEYRTR